jgi:hypothetical protein
MLLPVVASLSYLVVLATGVVANPILNRGFQAPISLPITRNMSLAGSINFVQRDRARLKNLADAATGLHHPFGASDLGSTPDIPLDDMGTRYATEIGVGDPVTYCEPFQFLPRMVSYVSILDYLIVDTGSSNTWVGGFKPYRKTTTSVKTGDSIVSIMSRDSWPISK